MRRYKHFRLTGLKAAAMLYAGVSAVALLPSAASADDALVIARQLDINSLDPARGFCDTFFGPGKCDYEKMIDNIGKPYFLESPGLGLKRHPCSAPQFLAADAALYLKREHDIRYDDVAKIEVSIPPLRYARHYAPEVKTGLRGKFAINYVVAMGILDGKLELSTFTDETVNQHRVQEALRKVHVICDKSIPEPGPYCPVAVELKNGTRHSFTAKIAKGHPQNPMTESEVIEKFRANAKMVISERKTEELIGLVGKLETVSNVRRLIDLLTVAG